MRIWDLITTYIFVELSCQFTSTNRHDPSVIQSTSEACSAFLPEIDTTNEEVKDCKIKHFLMSGLNRGLEDIICCKFRLKKPVLERLRLLWNDSCAESSWKSVVDVYIVVIPSTKNDTNWSQINNMPLYRQSNGSTSNRIRDNPFFTDVRESSKTRQCDMSPILFVSAVTKNSLTVTRKPLNSPFGHDKVKKHFKLISTCIITTAFESNVLVDTITHNGLPCVNFNSKAVSYHEKNTIKNVSQILLTDSDLNCLLFIIGNISLDASSFIKWTHDKRTICLVNSRRMHPFTILRRHVLQNRRREIFPFKLDMSRGSPKIVRRHLSCGADNYCACNCLNHAPCDRHRRCPGICPFGWKGRSCNQSICPRNKYLTRIPDCKSCGPKECTGNCSCSPKEICHPFTGECWPPSCLLARKRSTCNVFIEECPRFTFPFPACNKKCHCLNNHACSPTTGVCLLSKCRGKFWEKPTCSERKRDGNSMGSDVPSVFWPCLFYAILKAVAWVYTFKKERKLRSLQIVEDDLYRP